MSLVSTASDSSSRSCRHSAATSAVLPEPTGPPMPMRSGSPGCARTRGRSVWSCGWPSMKCGGMVSLSGDEQGIARVRRAAAPGRRAEDRTGRRAPWPASRGGVLAQRRQLERQRGDVARVEGQQPLRGRRRTRHRGVHQRQRGLLGCQAAGARRPVRRPPADAVSAQAVPSRRPATPVRASRSSPRP